MLCDVLCNMMCQFPAVSPVSVAVLILGPSSLLYYESIFSLFTAT